MNRMKKCSAAGICGGCRYQGMEYQHQLDAKQKKTEKLLSGFGHVEKIEGCEDPYRYRNKVQVSFGKDDHNRIIMGNYVTSTHTIVPVSDCQLASEKANHIFNTIRKLAVSFRLSIFDEHSMQGFLRHVMVRNSSDDEEYMVVIVSGSPVFPRKNDCINALLKECPYITTIIHNVNNRHTSMILGPRSNVIYGKGYIEDELCGKLYRLSAQSFYQINHAQTEKLYRTAVEFAALTGKERVIDAYCGIGTIGMTVADKAREVLGVEINQQAIRDAVKNAKVNGVTNIRFDCQDAGKYMVELAKDNQKIDVVIMDPPRAGADEAFLSSLVRLKPEKIVYISCNPVTQKDDLNYLCKRGYQVKRIKPFDLFPFTEHVECVALLKKTK